MKVLDRIEEIFISLSLLIAVSLILVNVILRAFSLGLYWSEELIRYLLIWLTFVGISLCARNNEHISIEFVPELLKGKAKTILLFILYMLAIVFSCMLIWYSLEIVNMAYSKSQVSTALNLPFYIVYLIIPISGALMLIRYLHLLVKLLFIRSSSAE